MSTYHNIYISYKGSFVAADWQAGVPNEIRIVREGVPGPGQKGPHGLPFPGSVIVHVFEAIGMGALERVEVEQAMYSFTGDIVLRKSGLSPDFDGEFLVVS